MRQFLPGARNAALCEGGCECLHEVNGAVAKPVDSVDTAVGASAVLPAVADNRGAEDEPYGEIEAGEA